MNLFWCNSLKKWDTDDADLADSNGFKMRLSCNFKIIVCINFKKNSDNQRNPCHLCAI